MSSSSTPAINASISCKNPFPGLRPFTTEESQFFFGRYEQVNELLDRLMSTRFLAIIGSSGCGKSSLVRAGLLSELQDGFMADPNAGWRIAVMTPGDAQTDRLARELAKQVGLGEEDVRDAFHRSSQGIPEVIEQAQLPAGTKVFILADQFEELFRYLKESDPHTAHDDARRFVNLLLEAEIQDRLPIYVALTMRSEFIGRCTQFLHLPAAINAGLYLVPRLSLDQMREVIREPVATLDREITPALISRLLNQIGNDPDQLPVLQHGLMRLWSMSQTETDSPPIDVKHLEAIGGLDGALEQHIHEIFGDLTADQKHIAEIIFRNLTEVTEDGREIRKPIKEKEEWEAIERLAGANSAEIDQVVEQFSREGRSFLRVEGTVIDISHEALIRQWKDLKRWTWEEDAARKATRRVLEKAQEWEKGGFSTKLLFPRLDLDLYARLDKRYRTDLERRELARRFLKASRRKARIERWGMPLLLIFVVFFSILAGIYAWQSTIAKSQSTIAKCYEQVALSFAEASKAEALAANGEPQHSFILAHGAKTRLKDIDETHLDKWIKQHPDFELKADIHQCARKAYDNLENNGIFSRPLYFAEKPVHAFKVSPDGKWILVQERNGKLGLWRLPDDGSREPEEVYTADSSRLDCAVFTNLTEGEANDFLAVSSGKGIELVELSDPHLRFTRFPGELRQATLLFSPNNVWLFAYAGCDESLYHFQSATGKCELNAVDLATRDSPEITCAAFGPTDKKDNDAEDKEETGKTFWLAVGDKSNVVRLRRLREEEPSATPDEFEVALESILPPRSILLPDGIEQETGGQRSPGSDRGVTSIAISRDGRWLTASSDEYLSCIFPPTRKHMESGRPLREYGLPQSEYSAAQRLVFSSDGKWFFAHLEDNSLKVFKYNKRASNEALPSQQHKAPPPEQPLELQWQYEAMPPGHRVERPLELTRRPYDAVLSVDISRDGRWLALGREDHSVSMVRLDALRVNPIDPSLRVSPNDPSRERSSRPTELIAHDDAVSGVCFRSRMRNGPAPIPKWMISGSKNGYVRMWELTSEAAVLAGLDGVSENRKIRQDCGGKHFFVGPGSREANFLSWIGGEPQWLTMNPIEHDTPSEDGYWIFSDAMFSEKGGWVVTTWSWVYESWSNATSGRNPKLRISVFSSNSFYTDFSKPAEFTETEEGYNVIASVSPDGTWLAYCCDLSGVITLVDLRKTEKENRGDGESPKQRIAVRGFDRIREIAFSTHGRWLLAIPENKPGEAALIELTGSGSASLPCPVEPLLFKTDFNTDVDYAYFSRGKEKQWLVLGAGQHVHVWRVGNKGPELCVRKCQHSTSGQPPPRLSGDARIVLTKDPYGRGEFWQPPLLSGDAGILLTNVNGRGELWELASANSGKSCQLKCLEGKAATFSLAAFSPNGKLLATGHDKAIDIWELGFDDNQLRPQHRHASEVIAEEKSGSSEAASCTVPTLLLSESIAYLSFCDSETLLVIDRNGTLRKLPVNYERTLEKLRNDVVDRRHVKASE